MARGTVVLPESYGPLVFTFPAVWWSILQFGFSGLALFGVVTVRPVVAALGNLLLGLLFVVFAVAAVIGGFNEPILVSLAWPACSLIFLCAWICWRGRDG